MNKKFFLGFASVLFGSIIFSKGLEALSLVMKSLKAGRFELSALIAGIIFIAVIFFGSSMILGGNDYLRK